MCTLSLYCFKKGCMQIKHTVKDFSHAKKELMIADPPINIAHTIATTRKNIVRRFPCMIIPPFHK